MRVRKETLSSDAIFSFGMFFALSRINLFINFLLYIIIFFYVKIRRKKLRRENIDVLLKLSVYKGLSGVLGKNFHH